MTGCSAEVGAADGGVVIFGSRIEVEGSEMIDWSVDVEMAQGRVIVNEELEGIVVRSVRMMKCRRRRTQSRACIYTKAGGT